MGHVHGEVQRRLLRYTEGLKKSSCRLRIPAYGHFKVVVYNFEAVPYFG